jgi:hypothetical protein
LILAGSSDVGTQFALFAKIEYRQSDDEPDATALFAAAALSSGADRDTA